METTEIIYYISQAERVWELDKDSLEAIRDIRLKMMLVYDEPEEVTELCREVMKVRNYALETCKTTIYK